MVMLYHRTVFHSIEWKEAKLQRSKRSEVIGRRTCTCHEIETNWRCMSHRMHVGLGPQLLAVIANVMA